MLKNELNLALFGQIYDTEGLLYAYPVNLGQLRYSGKYPAWLNALPLDSRFLREFVVPGGECFSVRFGNEGLFYLFTRYNQHDSRNGAVSVVIYTRDKAISNAAQLIIVLRNVMDYFLEKTSPVGISDAEVEELVTDLQIMYRVELPTQKTEDLRNDVYHVYQDDVTLERYLGNVSQNEYAECKWAHFIPAKYKKPIINPALYTESHIPIQDCYVLVRDGATKELVLSGKKIHHEYYKEGYLPHQVDIMVGQPSKYVYEENHMIHIKSANELDIKFKKRIKILLYDEATGEPIKEKGEPISFSEEVEQGAIRRTWVSANGYESKEVELDPTKQRAAEGTMIVRLQRIPPKSDSDENRYVRIPTKQFIIASIVAMLVFLVAGGMGGFFAHSELASSDTKDTSTIDQLHYSISNLNNTVDSLNRIITIKTDSIQELSKKIQSSPEASGSSSRGAATTSSSCAGGQSQSSSTSDQDLENKAWYYLNNNNTWSLVEMKKACDNNKNVSRTPAYIFLLNILTANFDNIDYFKNKINNPNLTSEDWINIKDLVNNKIDGGKDISFFTTALKDSNSNWDSFNKQNKQRQGRKLKLQDGTITNLINNLSKE